MHSAITFGNCFRYDTTIVISNAHDKKARKKAQKKARNTRGREEGVMPLALASGITDIITIKTC
jgi:hypothetical protein